MARPTVNIDIDQLSVILRLKPKAEDCAAFFKCSVDTIERRIREHTKSTEHPDGLTFAEFREQNMVHTRFNIVRKAIEKAEGGDNVMMIFCLKNLCDWKDKQAETPDVQVVNVTASAEEWNEAKEKRLNELLAKSLSETNGQSNS